MVSSFYRKEVSGVPAIYNFLMSVLANVVSYYICKRLDR